jgi:hypothetical protein
MEEAPENGKESPHSAHANGNTKDGFLNFVITNQFKYHSCFECCYFGMLSTAEII